MSSTNRASLRAGVLGLMVGCVPAVWLVGLAAAAPNPAPPAVAAVPTAQQELRSHFPFQSLSARLDYETASRPAPSRAESAPRMTGATEKRLAAVEEQLEAKWFNERTGRLTALYTDPIPRLSNQQLGGQLGMIGVQFGMIGGVGGSIGQSGQLGGMLGGSFGQSIGQIGQLGGFHLTREQLELPPAPAISFAAFQAPARVGGEVKPPKRDRLALLHTNGLLDFLNPTGFGYIQDLEHIAGFQPHQFRRMPLLFTPENAPPGKVEQWAVVRLELVCLRRQDRPCVCVTNALPRMTDAQGAPTRPLAPFEKNALKALIGGGDLATESSGDRIRMMGSLRAAKQCLECHDAKRGDLLGALSWDLQRQTMGEP